MKAGREAARYFRGRENSLEEAGHRNSAPLQLLRKSIQAKNRKRPNRSLLLERRLHFSTKFPGLGISLFFYDLMHSCLTM
jgi:hypothetical protein